MMWIFPSSPSKGATLIFFTSTQRKRHQRWEFFSWTRFSPHSRQSPSLQPFFCPSPEDHVGKAVGLQHQESVWIGPLETADLVGGWLTSSTWNTGSAWITGVAARGPCRGAADEPTKAPTRQTGSFQHLPDPQKEMPSYGSASSRGEKPISFLSFFLPNPLIPEQSVATSDKPGCALSSTAFSSLQAGFLLSSEAGRKCGVWDYNLEWVF